MIIVLNKHFFNCFSSFPTAKPHPLPQLQTNSPAPELPRRQFQDTHVCQRLPAGHLLWRNPQFSQVCHQGESVSHRHSYKAGQKVEASQSSCASLPKAVQSFIRLKTTAYHFHYLDFILSPSLPVSPNYIALGYDRYVYQYVEARSLLLTIFLFWSEK